MNIAILEDDPGFAAWLDRQVCQLTHFPPALNTPNCHELERYIAESTGATLYFLDIVLFGVAAGLSLGTQIASRNRGDLFVYLTSYPQKIIGSTFHQIHAFNTIFKASKTLEQEIRDTITLAREAIHSQGLLIHNARFESICVPYREILCIEHIKGTNKVCVQAHNGEFVIRQTLNALQALLDDRFVRCHKGFILNTEHIRSIDHVHRQIILLNDHTVPYTNNRFRNGAVCSLLLQPAKP